MTIKNFLFIFRYLILFNNDLFKPDHISMEAKVKHWLKKEGNILNITHSDFFIQNLDCNIYKDRTKNLVLLGNYDFICNNKSVLNFEYVSNLYVLHIRINYRTDGTKIFNNFLDYEVKLYSNKKNFLGTKKIDVMPYNINYDLNLIKQEFWSEYLFNFYNIQDRDENIKLNNIIIWLVSSPKDFIVRHIYNKKYYKNNLVKLNLKKVVFFRTINNNFYKIFNNLHYSFTNVYSALVIDELNRVWEPKVELKNSMPDMIKISKFLYDYYDKLETYKVNKLLSDNYIKSKKENIVNIDNNSWLHGHIPFRYFYLSLIYKDHRLILFNHITAKIVKEWFNTENINKYLFIKNSIPFLLRYIEVLNSRPNIKFYIIVPDFKEENFNVEIQEAKHINKYLFRYNLYFIENLFKDSYVKVLPLNLKSNSTPPVIYFILKNWYKSNLNMLILKRLIKKEKNLDNKKKWILYKNDILKNKVLIKKQMDY